MNEKEIEKKLEKKIEKEVEKGVTVGITVFITVAITFAISVVFFKFVWSWVMPDLFPGAVDQGLIAKDLSWLATLKLAVFVSLIGGFYPAINDAVKTGKDEARKNL